MHIESFFPKDHVLFLKNNEKQLVLKEIIDRLEEMKKISISHRYYAQVVHRESLENTGLGSGLAIPHSRTDSVSDLITIFAISPEGIQYESYDKVPVKYLLLSIFPSTMSTKYLYLVGMIARIFSNTETRKLLEEADTVSKIYSVLGKESELYFTEISQRSKVSVNKPGDLSGVPSSNLDLLIRLDRMYELMDKGDSSQKTMNKIEELKKLIDIKSLTYYEKMRKKCQYSFAILDKDSCTGCHMMIAPTYISEIKKSENISVCNHCGRFLLVL